MSQIFTIENDKVVIQKLALENLEGNIVHLGELSLSGPVEVTGILTADTIKVKNLITETGVNTNFGTWVVNNEADLSGKGLSWTWGEGNVQLAYKSGNRLWSNSDIDIDADKSFMIDGVAVLSKSELNSQVTKSRLKEVGTLRSLTVSGDVALAEFAIFNSTVNRLGLNTDEPNGTLSIVENDVEIIAGSAKDGQGMFGTYTNHDLELISDNTTRIKIKNNGQVIFGNESTKNADVRIYGTLTVDTVVSDNRIDRYSPLEFKTSRDQAIYGQGLIWTGTGGTRQFIMRAGPDRLWTTESLDLAEDQSYFINNKAVLSTSALGDSVTISNLSKLGVLEDLTVQGEATFMDRLNATRSIIHAKNILFNDGDEFTITNSKLSSSNSISLEVAGDEAFYAGSQEITIGNKQNTRRPVKLFGPVSVGVNSPDADVDLSVKGSIKFSDKKFVTGDNIPTAGSFNKGDICWNDNPTPGNYIGWVCIQTGSPGQWVPFGEIKTQ
jgi:hypothetical protein